MEKIKIMIFKKSGKWYETLDYIDIPEWLNPWGIEFVNYIKKLGGNDPNFNYVIIDHTNNRRFFTQLLEG